MTRVRFTRRCTVFATVVLLSAIVQASAAENLGDVLRETGGIGLIGTWVDAETKGARNKVTYAWKYEDHVLESTSREGDKETYSLMGRNPKTGEVFSMGADNQGGSFIGKWVRDDSTGDGILELVYVSGEGQEVALKLRHRLEDSNTLMITGGMAELPEAIAVKMVRSK